MNRKIDVLTKIITEKKNLAGAPQGRRGAFFLPTAAFKFTKAGKVHCKIQKDRMYGASVRRQKIKWRNKITSVSKK